MGLSRISTSSAAKLVPTDLDRAHDQIGASVDLPLASLPFAPVPLECQPTRMAASLEPVVEQPMVLAASGEFQRSAIMWTQRSSIAAVCGYHPCRSCSCRRTRP